MRIADPDCHNILGAVRILDLQRVGLVGMKTRRDKVPGSPELIDVVKAAELMGRSVNAVRCLARKGRLSKFSSDRCVRFSRSEVLAFCRLDQNRLPQSPGNVSRSS